MCYVAIHGRSGNQSFPMPGVNRLQAYRALYENNLICNQCPHEKVGKMLLGQILELQQSIKTWQKFRYQIERYRIRRVED